MVQPNYDYRATTDNPDERRAVTEAFAKSMLWGFTVGGRDRRPRAGRRTDFLLRDAHGVVPRLKPASYRLDTLAQRREPGPHEGLPAATPSSTRC